MKWLIEKSHDRVALFTFMVVGVLIGSDHSIAAAITMLSGALLDGILEAIYESA